MSHRPHVLNISHIRSRTMVKQDESHLHGWNELVMILSGEYTATYEGRAVKTQPGTVLYYGKGRRHAWKTQAREYIEYYLLQFESDGALPASQTFHAHDHSGQLRGLFRRIEEFFAAPNRDHELIDSYLAVILHEYQATASKAESEWIRKVRSFVYSRLDRPIRLRDMARAAGLSPFHFSRAFKQKTGLSPMRFLRKVRAEAALPLLKGTDLPHKAIAREIGLANERDLYRLFMATQNKSPSDFRPRRQRHS